MGKISDLVSKTFQKEIPPIRVTVYDKLILVCYPTTYNDEFWIMSHIRDTNIPATAKELAILTLARVTKELVSDGESVPVYEEFGISVSKADKNEDGTVKPHNLWSQELQDSCADAMLNFLKTSGIPSAIIEASYDIFRESAVESIIAATVGVPIAQEPDKEQKQ